jgi:aryl-alcohol dehydrogenase-like predicted oxidoreductase
MKLALGTVQFGLNYGVANTSGQVSSEVARDILQHAHQSGIDTLDTAIAYGESESVLGKIGVQAWKVVTKLPAVPDGCTDVTQWVQALVQGSLGRIGIDSLHGLLLHRPGQLLEDIGAELFAALQSIKADGLVAKVGISVYGPAELDALHGRYTFDLVQAPLNILDRSLVDSGWAQRLKNDGVEVHTRSAFLQGLLLMTKEKRHAKFDRWKDIWSEWDQWLAEAGLSSLQACLRYANTLDCIDRVVVGVDNVAQLEGIIAATEGVLPSLPQFKTLQDDRLVNPATWNQL